MKNISVFFGRWECDFEREKITYISPQCGQYYSYTRDKFTVRQLLQLHQEMEPYNDPEDRMGDKGILDCLEMFRFMECPQKYIGDLKELAKRK